MGRGKPLVLAELVAASRRRSRRQLITPLLSEALAAYLQPHLLVVDEVGYLSFGTDAADVLFHDDPRPPERHPRRLDLDAPR